MIKHVRYVLGMLGHVRACWGMLEMLRRCFMLLIRYVVYVMCQVVYLLWCHTQDSPGFVLFLMLLLLLLFLMRRNSKQNQRIHGIELLMARIFETGFCKSADACGRRHWLRTIFLVASQTITVLAVPCLIILLNVRKPPLDKLLDFYIPTLAAKPFFRLVLDTSVVLKHRQHCHQLEAVISITGNGTWPTYCTIPHNYSMHRIFKGITLSETDDRIGVNNHQQ